MILGLLLAASTVGPPVPLERRQRTVAIRWDSETKSCVPTVSGIDTGDVATERGKAALAGALPDRGATLRISGTTEAPYACTAALIDALRHAGFYGRIGMTGDPVPTEAAR